MVKIINCDKKIFKRNINDKRLFCFGAGKIFRKFVDENEDMKIEAVIDNHNSSEYVECQRCKVKVITYAEFVQICDESCAVLITTKYYNEIVNQMDAEVSLTNLSVYVLFLMEQYYSISDDIRYAKENQRIPKVIHYCWFGGNPLPENYKKYIESWKKYCPEYEIIRWDESNYNVNKNTYIKQAYENKKWAFVSDYARIDVIYNHGGIYLDTDVELLQSLDDFLGWDLFCGFETGKYLSFGLGFGAMPKHWLLGDMKKYYENATFVNSDGSLNMEICPIINTRYLEKKGFKRTGEFQCIDNIAVYPMEVFAPYNYVTNLYNLTEHSHSIHHYSASWLSESYHSNQKKRFVDVAALLNRSVDDETAVREKGYQIYEYVLESKSAGSKAVKDIKSILQSQGYKSLGVIQNSIISEQWEDIYIKIVPESIVVLQHPFWSDCPKRFEVLEKLKHDKRVKFICIVHDVEKLRKTFNNDYMNYEYRFMLDLADVIVAHNCAMKDFFKKETIKPVVTLDIFDYLFRGTIQKRQFDKSVIIAGNLDANKSKYLRELETIKGVHFNLFGPNYCKATTETNITYYGAISSDLVPLQLVGGFGLVWDGESIDTCAGNMGQYLRYNNPHKLSLYLAAGIPVIIWSQAAESRFVLDNKVGVVVDSLREIKTIFDRLDEQQYEELLGNASRISKQLRGAYYTKKAIAEAERILQDE